MVLEIAYPNNIREEKYKYRSVTITAKENEVSFDARKAYEKATSITDGLFEQVKNDPTDVFSVLKNIDYNAEITEGKTIGQITLPLPNAFSDSQNHGWSRETGIIGSIGRNITNMTAGDIVGAAPFAGGLGNLANKITGSASIDKILGSASSQLGTRKALIDPGYFQNYTGSEPRTFNMTFDLVPKNPEEAEQILLIIYKMKQWASPSKQINGVSLLAPYWFEVKISNDYISGLAKMNRVVLTSLNVDYGADGAMQQTADGTPKYIVLSMTFQEASVTTADDYNSRPRKPQRLS